MMSLLALISLNLSNNHLEGEISKQIGEMKALESIDFSLNQLSGEIPQSMSTMSFLSHLNLSHNNLTRMIPLGIRLQRFSATSFVGNNLCGPPLTPNCNTSTGSVEKKNIEDDDCGLSWPWFYIGMGVGFAASFWGVCGALISNKTWRYTYFWFLDYMTEKIYVVVAIKLRCLAMCLKGRSAMLDTNAVECLVGTMRGNKFDFGELCGSSDCTESWEDEVQRVSKGSKGGGGERKQEGER
ncbi:hypothetical protein FNV43_RR27180 [Rhamnella rubrinervis]|uniref:Uncharacterized protein n=1 Tax=Rhamnella rubrinervis TaxID=2594499 RepID=A0A8K0DK41_9ROSA|nr:hypothetical protein FNV43_RR27180 [Rhamnella rubrinervis]